MSKAATKKKEVVQQDTAAISENGYLENGVAVKRLTKDLTAAARSMTADEARFLVDYYYICQDDRIRFNGQIRSMNESQEPNMVLHWLADQADVLESQVKRALDKYTDDHPIGAWIKSLYGFGPVLAAGFIAHIDIYKAPTAGHIWSYAGLLPGVKWEKGQKRPWNAELKKLCWKAGECLVKFSNKEECYYGQLFRQRKAMEWDRNLSNGNAAVAMQDAARYAKNTEAYAWVNGCFKSDDIAKMVNAGISMTPDELKKVKGEVGSGNPMLPPAQIHARARRFAIKIFLSHLQTVWYEKEFKCRAPRPFMIEHGGHAHEIAIPNYESPYRSDAPSMPFKVIKGGKN